MAQQDIQQDPWRDERDEGASPSQLSGSCATRHCHAGGPAHRTPPKAVCCESSTSGSDTEDPVPDLLEGGLTSSSDSYAANSDEANYSRKPDNSRKAREQRRGQKRNATASAVLLRGYGPTYTAVEVTSRGSLHSHFCIRSRV